MFNADDLMNDSVSDAMDTKFIAIPPGEWTAIIDKLELKSDVSKKTGEAYLVCNITWSITDDSVKKAVGLEKATIRQSFFPDITEAGKLDYSKGKNVALGRIREAVGMNKPGESFNLGMLNGAGPALIHVVATPARDGSGEIYSNVKSVGKLK